MTALYIILGILAFIMILLLCPLKIYLEYDEEIRLKVGYLFLKFPVYPQKSETPEGESEEKKSEPKKQSEKKSEVKQEPAPQPKKKNPILEYKDKHGLDGLIELVKKIVAIVVDVLKGMAKHLVIQQLDICALIVGDDSADTAMKYGYACSVIYPALSILDSRSKLKHHSEDISAGFLAEKTAVELKMTAKIKPLFLLIVLVPAAVKFIRTIAKAQ